jgi:hypothetical protein
VLKKKLELKKEIKGMKIKIENMLKGKKLMGEKMKKLMKEKWREMVREME